MKKRPGQPLDDDARSAVFASFLCKYGIPAKRDKLMREYMNPGCMFWGNLFDTEWLPDHDKMFVIWENGPYLDPEINEMMMYEFRQDLSRREPWDWEDTYILTESQSTCIIITHDDETLLAVADNRTDN